MKNSVDEAKTPLANVSGWQLIETAPKDITHRSGSYEYGRNVLIYDGNVTTACWWQCRKKDGEIYGSNWIDNGANALCPTHWMPLPAPPISQDCASAAAQTQDVTDHDVVGSGLPESESSNAAALEICDYCGIDQNDSERVATIISKHFPRPGSESSISSTKERWLPGRKSDIDTLLGIIDSLQAGSVSESSSETVEWGKGLEPLATVQVENTSLRAKIKQIQEVADAGSAQEFGDAKERLEAISRMASTGYIDVGGESKLAELEFRELRAQVSKLER